MKTISVGGTGYKAGDWANHLSYGTVTRRKIYAITDSTVMFFDGRFSHIETFIEANQPQQQPTEKE